MNVLDNELDFQILKMLQVDGRMSFTEMSNEINVAVSTIRHRYLNLIEDGTIKIIGRVDPHKIGYNCYASILIAVKPKSHLNDIFDILKTLPEVTFIAMISGDFDIEINVMCHNMEYLNELITNKIHTIDGIFDTKTNMYMKTYKFSQPDLDLAKSLNK